MRPIIREIQNSGIGSLRGVAKALIAGGIKTARGGSGALSRLATFLSGKLAALSQASPSPREIGRPLGGAASPKAEAVTVVALEGGQTGCRELRNGARSPAPEAAAVARDPGKPTGRLSGVASAGPRQATRRQTSVCSNRGPGPAAPPGPRLRLYATPGRPVRSKKHNV